MLDAFNFIQTYWLLPILIFLIIAVLFYRFLAQYQKQAKNLVVDLDTAISKINATKIENIKSQDKNELELHLNKTRFVHAWHMYSSTLHDHYEKFDGEDVLTYSRATVSSEYFFNQSLLVDTPLKVEFYKHLPSIMTGIGIIGTFAGLLLGLLQFDPAGDPANIQSSLKLLLHGVSEAFVASGFAIAAAMYVTWKEKSWLRTCYAKLEDLTTAIDSLFEADTVGEEYLAKLIKSSEDNATQTKQLKDSLVTDLKEMMANMVAENQKSQQELALTLSKAYQDSGSDMAEKIGQSITSSLQEPLDKIANSVNQVSGDQGTAVQSLLNDVLVAFMNRLESTFGNQMSGMGEMMAQSVSAMKEMQTGFSNLIADMKHTNESSSKAIEEQMIGMLTRIQEKQQDMSGSMAQMLETIRESVVQIGDTGADAAKKMNIQAADMLVNMNNSITEMMKGITQQRIEQDQVVATNQEMLHNKTNGLIDGLTEQITLLLQESQTAINSTRKNIEELTRVSTSSIQGMNDGAEKMRLAAERFTDAGKSLNSVTEGSTALLSQVNTLSLTMVNTTTQLKDLVNDYQHSRDAVNKSIIVLESLIESAKRETGMSSQMLNDMQMMTKALTDVRNEMQGYLTQVSDVLVKGFDSFGAAVETSLSRALGSFDNTLDQAVKRLASGVEGLSNITEEISEITHRKHL